MQYIVILYHFFTNSFRKWCVGNDRNLSVNFTSTTWFHEDQNRHFWTCQWDNVHIGKTNRWVLRSFNGLRLCWSSWNDALLSLLTYKKQIMILDIDDEIFVLDGREITIWITHESIADPLSCIDSVTRFSIEFMTHSPQKILWDWESPLAFLDSCNSLRDHLRPLLFIVHR